MEKFYEENCLYEQHFIKDEGMTVKELVDQAIAKMGENITDSAFFAVQGGRRWTGGFGRRLMRTRRTGTGAHGMTAASTIWLLFKSAAFAADFFCADESVDKVGSLRDADRYWDGRRILRGATAKCFAKMPAARGLAHPQ